MTVISPATGGPWQSGQTCKNTCQSVVSQGSRRSKDQEILEEGGGAGLSKLDLFCFELSKLFVSSSATVIVFVTVQAQQLKQQLRSALVAGQWRGNTALTLPLFWRRYPVSPRVFFGRFPRSSLHSVVPFPLCPRP